MKLLLVDNLILPERGSLATLDVHPHLGLLALAAAAQADGHEVAIVDPKRLVRDGELPHDETLYEHMATRLLAAAPQAVGFTALGCSLLFALRVAEALKRREPGLPLLLGGPHASMLDAEILQRCAAFDVIARHECDETLAPLLHALPSRRFAHIPGLSWRGPKGAICRSDGRPKVEDLDTLPLLDYGLYPVEQLGLELLRIEAGRGCPYACTFCSTAGFFQRSFRMKSAARLVSELDRLHARYGRVDFKLDHDMFTVSRRKVLEFCEAVRGRGYRWRASARVDGVDEALLATMADAGCVHLYFGIETGSARLQKFTAKRLDLAPVPAMLAAAERLGIETTASFITGFPDETQADQDDTLDLIGRLHGPRCLTQLHLLAPEPGTPLFDRHRAAMAFDGQAGPYNAELLGAADEALVRAEPVLFATYHHYPGVLPRARHRFAAEAAATLRRLGPRVLRYLLRGWGGRLSRLLHDWREAAAQPDEDTLCALVARRVGDDHHLLSLMRYAMCRHAAAAGQPAAAQGLAFDPARAYRLQAGARVLHDLHDCETVLAGIAASPGEDWLDDGLFTGRRGYLFAPGPQGRRAWVLDPGAAAIVALFDEPRRCRDVIGCVAAMAGGVAPDEAFFAELAREQVLVAAEP